MEDNFISRFENLFNETDDSEFVKKLAELYHEFKESESNSDYRVNDEQMHKLVEIIGFFRTEATEQNKESEEMIIKPSKLVPKYETGGLTVEFYALNLCGDRLKEFLRLMDYASAIGFDATMEGKACIGITIPDVFVEK